MRSRSLDVNRVASTLDNLVFLCLEHDGGKDRTILQEAVADAISRRDYQLLRDWRNSAVHGHTLRNTFQVGPSPAG